MPRLRQVSRAEASPTVLAWYEQLFGERDPVAEPGTETGTPGNWWTVFALVPGLLQHAVDGFKLLGILPGEAGNVLDPRLRELALIRTGYVVGSQFVYSQHCKVGRAVGLREAQIGALAAWSVSSEYSPRERAVLSYTDALVIGDGRLSDAEFAQLAGHLSDAEILELGYAIGTYRMHATLSRALRLEYDDVDDRVREIPAPE